MNEKQPCKFTLLKSGTVLVLIAITADRSRSMTMSDVVVVSLYPIRSSDACCLVTNCCYRRASSIFDIHPRFSCSSNEYSRIIIDEEIMHINISMKMTNIQRAGRHVTCQTPPLRKETFKICHMSNQRWTSQSNPISKEVVTITPNVHWLIVTTPSWLESSH